MSTLTCLRTHLGFECRWGRGEFRVVADEPGLHRIVNGTGATVVRRLPERGPRSAPVMHDVARLAGVSQQTVSRVANGHSNVSDGTRQRVVKAMDQLGFHPNYAARALVTNRSGTIGVLGIETAQYGPAELLLGIEKAAGAAGYRVTITNVPGLSKALVEPAYRRFADQSVDGIILIQPVYSASKVFRALRKPVVALGRAATLGVPSVGPDNAAAAGIVVDHLLGFGHATVWHVAGPEHWSPADDRIKGWRAALERAGRQVPPFERGDWTPGSGYEIGRRLADHRDVSAIFVGNDQMAVGVLRAMKLAGRRVPDDVSVVGFDDIPEAEFVSPPLTTVRQDLRSVSASAVDLLLEMVNGRRPAVRHRITESILVGRESTAPRRGHALTGPLRTLRLASKALDSIAADGASPNATI